MLRSLTACTLMLWLSACAPIVAGGSAGAIATGVALLSQGVTVLSDAATLACGVQAIANTTHMPTVSTDAGKLCAW